MQWLPVCTVQQAVQGFGSVRPLEENKDNNECEGCAGLASGARGRRSLPAAPAASVCSREEGGKRMSHWVVCWRTKIIGHRSIYCRQHKLMNGLSLIWIFIVGDRLRKLQEKNLIFQKEKLEAKPRQDMLWRMHIVMVLLFQTGLELGRVLGATKIPDGNSLLSIFKVTEIDLFKYMPCVKKLREYQLSNQTPAILVGQLLLYKNNLKTHLISIKSNHSKLSKSGLGSLS